MASAYMRASMVVLEAIRLTSNAVQQISVRKLSDQYFPAAELWHFLCKEFSSEANMSQNELIHEMTCLTMEPWKADEYIAQKMKLSDRLFAVNYPITKISFYDYLVHRLPEEWATFKITMRGLS